MFVYQPTFKRIKYKNTNIECITDWISNGLYNSRLNVLNSDFLLNIKYFTKRMGIQFNNIPLVVEQSNHTTEIVNVYIVYDLDNWPNVPLRNLMQLL